MYWATVFILIISCWASSRAQLVLTQPPAVSVSPGQAVYLPCTMGSSQKISTYVVYWFQQRLGGSPEYVLYQGTTTSRGPNISLRFSAARDTSRNVCDLSISNAQAEDDADYYCTVWSNSLRAWVFGPGTKLIVKTSAPKAPTISLLPPSSDELTNKKTATLVCLLGNFFPRTATVTWKGDNSAINSGILNSEVKVDSATDYMMSSYLTLSEQDWKAYDRYTCEVSHESKVITQSLKRSDCLPTS